MQSGIKYIKRINEVSQFGRRFDIITLANALTVRATEIKYNNTPDDRMQNKS